MLQRDLATSGLPTYFADLIVSRRSLDQEMSEQMHAEAIRLQRPYGGKLCWASNGKLVTSRRDALPGAGAWTHQYADPANTVNSGDALVKGATECVVVSRF